MQMSGFTVCATTLGCKVNQYDTDVMLSALVQSGFRIVNWGEPADVAIVNSCTVTATADAKSRSQIRHAARMGIPVCVCGCMAEHDAQKVLETDGVSAVVKMGERSNIVSIICGILGIPIGDCENVKSSPGRPRLRTRGFLKVQEGCSDACTYCIIPSVRGPAVTRCAEDIISDAAALARSGVKEIVLSGTNLSSYGKDSGESLTELVRQLSSVEGIERVRMGSLEPWLLTPEVADKLAACEKLCPHFHVSLQSGCEATLRRMKRRYTPDQYMRRIELLREVFNEPAITTDVVTGFPGETEEEFRESTAFVEQIGFARLHVFPYSEREGTPAAKMSGSVPVPIRRARAATMAEKGLHSQKNYVEQFLGTDQMVLFDREEHGGASGYTDRYVRVYRKGARPDTIERVRLAALSGVVCTGIQTHD